MTPLFKIEYNGKDITQNIAAHFVSLNLTDERGMHADNLTIIIEDVDSNLILPDAGSKIKLWLGTRNRGLIFKGLFTIDEITDTGPPDQIEINASSADFTTNLKVKKETFYENTTIGELVTLIAGQNQLEKSISPELAKREIDHIAQTNESDLNMLSRLAKIYGAFFAIKNQTLIFHVEAIGKTASGNIIPTFNLDRSDTVSHRFSERSRKNKFTGAKAAWHDITQSKKIWEIVGDQEKLSALNGVFPDAAQAKAAAQTEFDRLSRGEMTMSIPLSFGEPHLIPDTPIILSGFKSKITNVNWIIKSVTLDLGASGLTTNIDLEQKLKL